MAKKKIKLTKRERLLLTALLVIAIGFVIVALSSISLEQNYNELVVLYNDCNAMRTVLGFGG